LSIIVKKQNMEVDNELIKRLESLSMLSLSQTERDNLKPEIKKMITMVDKLSELDTSGITPLTNVNNHTQVLRSDKVDNMLSNSEALGNTKHKTGVYFKVPKVIK